MSETAKNPATTEFQRLFWRREEGLRRFEEWQAANPAPISAQAAWSGLALLYDLLPAESRTRPVDTAGVRLLHCALADLSTP